MKAVFEFDEATGLITGKNGMTTYCLGITPFDTEESAETKQPLLVELMKQGETANDLINMKEQGLL